MNDFKVKATLVGQEETNTLEASAMWVIGCSDDPEIEGGSDLETAATGEFDVNTACRMAQQALVMALDILNMQAEKMTGKPLKPNTAIAMMTEISTNAIHQFAHKMAKETSILTPE